MAPERKNLKNIIVLSIIIIICIVTITISFKQSGSFTGFKSFTLDFFQPIQQKTSQVFEPFVKFYTNIGDYFRIREKIEELRLENAMLLKDYSENINLRIENDALRSLIGIELRKEYNTHAARVIGHYSSKWQSEIIINAGKSSGITEGMAVVNEKGLVGVVTFSSSNTSQVRLLNDPQSSIGVRLLSSRRLGMVEGSTAKTIYLNYMLADDIVFKGDILITSEFGERIPPEILIGRIKKINPYAGVNYQVIEVEPFVDFKKLEYVLVIKN